MRPGTVSLAANGTWSATTPGSNYSGTAIPADSKGRKWILSFDFPSFLALRGVLEDWATSLCDEEDVTVDTVEVVKFLFKVNKTGDEATVKFKAKATGHTDLGNGKGPFKINLKGPWTRSP